MKIRSAIYASLVVSASIALGGYVWATGQVVTGQVIMNASFGLLSNAGVQANTISQSLSIPAQYSNGTGSNQIDTIYAAHLTLTGAPTTIDLSSLTDPAGNSANFARVREVIVQNISSTAGFDCKVEAGASNGWPVLPPSTAPLQCRYGATLRISDPVSTGSGNGNVVGASTKTVTFDPGANTVIINVLIVGGSAAFVVIPFRLRRYRRRLAA